MDKTDYEILVNSMPKGQRPPEFAVKLLEDTCASTGLDWKRRHVYLMERGGKWQVTLSIDGFRMVGAQDDAYGGQDGPFWTMGPESPWSDIPPETAPYAAKVGIKHKDGTTTWGIAKYKDYAAGPMWSKFPSTMIAKCAEMLAWRKAMPGRLGGLYGTEEMEQASKRRSSPPTSESEPSVSAYAKHNTALDMASRLSGEARLEGLKAVGKEIMADKSLSNDELNQLHVKYQELKGK